MYSFDTFCWIQAPSQTSLTLQLKSHSDTQLRTWYLFYFFLSGRGEKSLSSCLFGKELNTRSLIIEAIW